MPGQIISVLGNKSALTNVASNASGECFMTSVDMLFEAVGLITHKRTQMAQMTISSWDVITPVPPKLVIAHKFATT